MRGAGFTSNEVTKIGFDHQYNFIWDIWDCRIEGFTQLKGSTWANYRSTTNGGKSFGVHISNVAPGDFATNIAAGRYHAPIIPGSAYEIPYGNTLKTWMSMSMVAAT
jgi:hypothetical protein